MTKKKAPVAAKEVLFLTDWRNRRKGEIASYGIATVEALIEEGIAKLPTVEDRARVKKLEGTITDTALRTEGSLNIN